MFIGHLFYRRKKGLKFLGVKIVECADDIVEELWGFGRPPNSEVNALSADSSAVSVDPIVVRMEAGQAYDVDDLAALSGLETVRLLSCLIDLELQGRVRRVGGSRFMRC